MNGAWEKANYSGCEPWIKEHDSVKDYFSQKLMLEPNSISFILADAFDTFKNHVRHILGRLHPFAYIFGFGFGDIRAVSVS